MDLLTRKYCDNMKENDFLQFDEGLVISMRCKEIFMNGGGGVI